jgi:hypothetical protein
MKNKTNALIWGEGGEGPFYLNPKPSPQQPKPTREVGGHCFIIVYKRRCMHRGRISFWNLTFESPHAYATLG